MEINQFRNYIVRPVLKYLGKHSPDAEELLVATAVHESCSLQNIRQQGRGHALSFFQIELSVHKDVWDNYIAYHPELLSLMNRLRFDAFKNQELELMGNLPYSVAIARLIYFRARGALPDKGNIMEMAKYWKRNYRTIGGKGRVDAFVNDYRQYVRED